MELLGIYLQAPAVWAQHRASRFPERHCYYSTLMLATPLRRKWGKHKLLLLYSTYFMRLLMRKPDCWAMLGIYPSTNRIFEQGLISWGLLLVPGSARCYVTMTFVTPSSPGLQWIKGGDAVPIAAIIIADSMSYLGYSAFAWLCK